MTVVRKHVTHRNPTPVRREEAPWPTVRQAGRLERKPLSTAVCGSTCLVTAGLLGRIARGSRTRTRLRSLTALRAGCSGCPYLAAGPALAAVRAGYASTPHRQRRL